MTKIVSACDSACGGNPAGPGPSNQTGMKRRARVMDAQRDATTSLAMLDVTERSDSADNNEVRRIQLVYTERDRALKSNQVSPGRQRNLRERNCTIERMLGERQGRPLSECRILDVGCGKGSLLAWFNERGVPSANLFGIDLLPHRIKSAREKFPEFSFIEGSAEQIGFPDASFDIVVAFTMFSSILDGTMAKSVAQSIIRVLKKNGAVVWHDMRYPNPVNPNVRAMTKSRIRELFPSFELELELIYLLPPIANHLGRFTDRTYQILASIPALRSHYCGLLRPPRHLSISEIHRPDVGSRGVSRHA